MLLCDVIAWHAKLPMQPDHSNKATRKLWVSFTGKPNRGTMVKRWPQKASKAPYKDGVHEHAALLHLLQKTD